MTVDDPIPEQRRLPKPEPVSTPASRTFNRRAKAVVKSSISMPALTISNREAPTPKAPGSPGGLDG